MLLALTRECLLLVLGANAEFERCSLRLLAAIAVGGGEVLCGVKCKLAALIAATV